MADINYAQYQTNPLANINQGIQTAAQVMQLGQDIKQNQIKEDFKNDFSEYIKTPSSDKLLAMQVKYPQMSQAFEPLIKKMNKDQLDTELSASSQMINALNAGDTTTANSILDNHIQAAKNAGQNITTLDRIKTSLANDPTRTKAYLEFTMANLMGADKYKNWVDAQGETQKIQQEAQLFPSKKEEQEAQAKQAQIKAKYLEPQTLADIQKTNVDIQKLYNDMDIDKQKVKIDAMKAAYQKEDNQLKREELGLKIQEQTEKLNTEAREKASSANAAYTSTENALNTIDRALNTSKATVNAAHGPVSSVLPTLSQDVADYEATIQTLSSQAFLSQISAMKGMGALSDAEGKKLEAGMQSLSLKQSPEQMKTNLSEMKKLINKARDNISSKYGIKAPSQERPFLNPSNQEIDALLKKYGG